MPQPINRFPAGFLDLLGSKGTGDAPHWLSDLISPTVGMEPFYYGTTADHGAVSTAVINAPGFAPSVTSLFGSLPNLVPPGEMWIVHHAAARTGILAAATTYRARLAVILNGYSTPWVMSPADTATTGESFGTSFAGPLVLYPTHQLGIYAEAVTLGTAASFNIGLLVSRFQL